ncbi:MAG: carnitine 3-dehydrogenase [Pseudomonadota bacterium]
MREIQNVALIGGGVIGAAWAARMVINGLDVVICDPDPSVESRIQRVIENALRAYRNMTLAPVNASGQVSYCQDLVSAVEGADFVQESGPERIDVKKELIQTVCEHAPKDVVVASSSSGLLPSEMQSGVRYPERVLIGHPFNPVYLMPLVEIVGGKQTGQEAREAAARFYQGMGMHPLQVRKEIDAFLADRMMEALWREALHLVNDGVATAEEIDDAIRYGPGLRWSFMGTFMVYRIAGGEGGMRHFMQQFGPSLKWPWTRFDGPDLSPELLNNIESQSDRQADGRSIEELERLRDDCLVSVMQGLRSHDHGAGAVLKRYEERLYELSHNEVMRDGDRLDQPLELHTDTVRPEWVDYNNHMTESRYLQVFGDSSDALFRYIGIDADYHARGLSYYTVETHINHLLEVAVSKPLRVTTQILSSDEKRIRVFHTIYRADNDEKLATAEQMLLHVNTVEGRACPAESEIAARVARIAEAHSQLPVPDQAGRHVGQRKS